jgi:hypothetical protein
MPALQDPALAYMSNTLSPEQAGTHFFIVGVGEYAYSDITECPDFYSLNCRRQGSIAFSEHNGFLEKVRRTDERRSHFEHMQQEYSAVEW